MTGPIGVATSRALWRPPALQALNRLAAAMASRSIAPVVARRTAWSERLNARVVGGPWTPLPFGLGGAETGHTPPIPGFVPIARPSMPLTDVVDGIVSRWADTQPAGASGPQREVVPVSFEPAGPVEPERRERAVLPGASNDVPAPLTAASPE